MNEKMKSALMYFMMYWLLFGIGVYFGQFIPFTISRVISVVIVITMLATLLFRFGLPTYLLPIIAAGLGITSYHFLSFIVSTEGMDYFFSVVILAVLMFLTAGMVGMFVLRDVSNWGKYLLIALIVLIVLSLASMFLPIGGLGKILAIAGLILFLLYTVYDFNRMRNDNYEPAEMGFALFINLLNIIQDLLYLLREFNSYRD